MRRRRRLIYWRSWLISRCGFDVFFALCSQHKPSIGHRQQRTLRFRITEILNKLKAFLGVSPIPFYQLRHSSGPHHLKTHFCTNSIEKNSFRSVPHPRHAATAEQQITLLEIICPCIANLLRMNLIGKPVPTFQDHGRFCFLRMILSENRFPLFGIMRYCRISDG
jgi:hypothetical protein